MPWVQLLLVLAVVYIAVVVVRGLIEIGPWFMEEFIEPRRFAHPNEKAHRQRHETDSVHHPRKSGRLGYQEKVSISVLRITSRLADSLGFLKRLFARRDFGYWVGLALAESDPNTKVKYCSRALELNPGYEPAWGMKAITLFGLQRYDEALECFDRALEIRCTATSWCERGLCCYHLKRHKEAMACFDKALVACSDQNPRLFEEATRHRQLAEEALRQEGVEITG